jgi:hypothetical protein
MDLTGQNKKNNGFFPTLPKKTLNIYDFCFELSEK